jgi:hypothetical protein
MFNITSLYPGLIAVVFIIISLTISLYFYRNTAISGFKRYTLIAVKSLALFLLLVLFLEPSLIALVSSSQEKTNIIMIDATRSITLPSENNSPLSLQVKNIPLGKLFKGSHNYFFVFLNNIIQPIKTESIDSIDFDGYQTDATQSIKAVKDVLPDVSFNSFTLISDGLFNSGGYPLYTAKEFQCPFISVGIGDTIQRKDLLIDRVFYNDNMFTNTDNIIKAEIKSSGYQNESVTVDLLREGNVVSSNTLNIKSNDDQDEISFTIKENNPGIVKYRIRVLQKPGEITYKNNTEDFLISFIDSKINILYISDGPGYDNSLFSNILKRINNYKVTFRTAKSPNEFYEGPVNNLDWNELSAVFMLGFPSAQTGSGLVNPITEKVKNFNVPLIFFAGKNTDYKKLEAFGDLIPFSILRAGSETLFTPQLVSDPQNFYKDISSELSSTPQIFINQTGISQKPGSSVLMTDKSTGEPVLITRSPGKNNSTAFLGYGIWRWRLNPKSDYEKLVENFLLKTIDLTLLKEKKTKFKVYPDKNIFDYTENVTLTAEVYDDNNQLTGNAAVKCDIVSQGRKILQDLAFTPSENKYHCLINKLAPGDYTIEAEADMKNELYAKDNSRFLVDTINTEYKVTKSNFDNLKELSLNTGGQFFQAGSDYSVLEKFLDTLNNRSVSSSTPVIQKRFDLWENKYVLILIIVLFSVEWVIRKRNNLP